MDSAGESGAQGPAVLLVDDDAANREALREVLESGDVRVVGQAATGEEALEAVARLEPDVVLMDLRMPGMDGFEATAAIRETGSHSQVVILTAYEELLTKSAVEVGAFAYLVKGCSLDLMLTVIHQAWRRAEQARGDAADPG